jgi:hypothetical protein
MGATGGASHFRCHLYPSCYDSNALFSLILYINALPAFLIDFQLLTQKSEHFHSWRIALLTELIEPVLALYMTTNLNP